MNRNSMRSLFVLIVLCAPMLSVQAQVTLPSPPPTPGSDWFGRSVGIDGSRLVVGAALYDPGTPERTNAGAAFVFVNQGGTWVQEAMLTAPEVALSAGDGFGQAIAIDGDRIAVGAYNAEPAAGPNSPGYAGAAYVFMRDTTTGTWNRTRLVPLDDQTQAWLGSTIDIDGDTIIVGAYNYDEGGYSNLNPGAIQNSGAAYILQYDGTNWVQQARLAPPLADRVPQQRFGQSVAIDGDVALIGAYGPNNGIGDAYVSTRTGSTWSEPVKLPRSASQVNGGYGHTVALDFPNAMVSAVQHNPGGTNRVGAVHFYRYDSGSWSETALVVNPDPQHLAYFGFSLDILGDWAFVGARADNVGAVNSAGSVIVYRWDGTAWTYDRTLTSDAPLLNAFFGGAVSFDGTQLLVGEYGRNTGKGSATVFSLVDPADLSIVKTLTTTAPFVEGQSVSYTLELANAGPADATAVEVTDAPTNLAIASVTGGGCTSLPCTIASLTSGSSVTINVTATIQSPGAFDNSASVSASEPDPNLADNTDSTGNGGTAAAAADLSLTKTLNTAGPWIEGQSVSYSIAITNLGPSAATSLSVSDVPSNLAITSVSGAGCTAFPCAIATLGSGAVATINILATVAGPGAFDNGASVSATEVDGDLSNNSDPSGNGGIAAAAADIALVKTLTTAGPWSDGQTLDYTIEVSNLGPSAATALQITDTPTNLTIDTVSGGCTALPCTIASLAPMTSVTIGVSATIAGPGAFDNGASVSATEVDGDPSNNSDPSGNGGTALASADLSVTKQLTTVGPYHAGQGVSYTILIENAGPSPATSIGVTDTPTNLTTVSVSGSGCAALPCILPALAVGAATTITVEATIAADGAFSNAVSVAGAEDDPNVADNSDLASDTAAASADVSMVKTLVTPPPYNAGETVTYTLVVSNAGPSTATSIEVTDMPSGITIAGVSGACASLPCTIASLASGASATIDLVATLDPGSDFDNSASASAAEHDPDLANNTDATGNGGTTGAAVDVSIAKTLATAGPFVDGQSVAYTLLVGNAGPSTANELVITDTPSNLAITAVSGAGCSALPCTIPSLAAGASVTIDVAAQITSAGVFDNAASISANESDLDLSNNNDTTGNGGVAAASADLGVTKTLVTAGPFSAGQDISYLLVVSNAGPSPATGVVVTDTPSNLTFTSVSGACSALPCTIASIPAGATASIDVTATIDAAGAFDNAVTVAAAEDDPDNANNNDSNGNGGTAAASADLSVVKTLTTAGPFEAGQTVSYTIVVANAGPSPATAVTLADTPSGQTIVSVSGPCTALPCTIASLAPGASTTVDVTATIDGVGGFDNSASVSGAEPDPDESNNTDATGNGGAVGEADVSVVSTLVTSDPFFAGQVVTYSIVVTNAGPVASSSIEITNTWTNLTVTGVSGACAALPCTLASLAVNATATIEVTATIDADGAFDQGVSVMPAEVDPDMSNNADSTGNGGIAQPAAAIPFTDTTVLMLLGLALAIVGARFIRGN